MKFKTSKLFRKLLATCFAFSLALQTFNISSVYAVEEISVKLPTISESGFIGTITSTNENAVIINVIFS